MHGWGGEHELTAVLEHFSEFGALFDVCKPSVVLVLKHANKSSKQPISVTTPVRVFHAMLGREQTHSFAPLGVVVAWVLLSEYYDFGKNVAVINHNGAQVAADLERKNVLGVLEQVTTEHWEPVCLCSDM